MELARMEKEPVARRSARRMRVVEDRWGYPLENPGIDPIPDDPLCEPHPGEPGVKSDGSAAPPENPGDPFD